MTQVKPISTSHETCRNPRGTLYESHVSRIEGSRVRLRMDIGCAVVMAIILSWSYCNHYMRDPCRLGMTDTSAREP